MIRCHAHYRLICQYEIKLRDKDMSRTTAHSVYHIELVTKKLNRQNRLMWTVGLPQCAAKALFFQVSFALHSILTRPPV
jgi:hypothetical protein